LTEPKRKVTNVTSNPSMAEGVQRWEKKTPERFHTSRHGEVFRMVEVSFYLFHTMVLLNTLTLTSNNFVFSVLSSVLQLKPIHLT